MQDDAASALQYNYNFPEINIPESNATLPLDYAVPNISTNSTSQPSSLMPGCWQELTEQLVLDGFEREQVEALFTRLGDRYSSAPMKTKLKELYKVKFVKKPKKPKGAPSLTYYRNVVTPGNINRARDFIVAHQETFAKAQKEFGVPPEIAASLLLIETDLGHFLGKEKAIVNLASMSISTSPEAMTEHLPDVSGNATKETWMQDVMTNKSTWAYGELKAFLTYCFTNNLDPLSMDGSIYGAIGFCQFMPSNILLYGTDGNADGKVDLFTPEDAIYSLCKYLKEHGWKAGITRKQQHAVLLQYNRSNMYANTILVAADKLVIQAKLQKLKH